ncbi:MAG TPA: DUF6152 family protein [Steroidobacteraceae bacterium]|nr:DUF6152 family protein [Steroidobacteraceae bacterium]
MRYRVLWALVLSAVSGIAAAHHSFAMFDSDHQIRLTGKVEEFTWQNPHIYIHLQAKNAKGKLADWVIECANPGILNRAGWKFNMIKKGDQLTVVVAPLRTGEPGALLKQVKLADGRIFGNGGPAGPPNISIEDGKPLAAGAKP